MSGQGAEFDWERYVDFDAFAADGASGEDAPVSGESSAQPGLEYPDYVAEFNEWWGTPAAQRPIPSPGVIAGYSKLASIDGTLHEGHLDAFLMGHEIPLEKLTYSRKGDRKIVDVVAHGAWRREGYLPPENLDAVTLDLVAYIGNKSTSPAGAYEAWAAALEEKRPAPKKKVISGYFGLAAHQLSVNHLRVFEMVQGYPRDTFTTSFKTDRSWEVVVEEWPLRGCVPLTDIDPATVTTFLSLENQKASPVQAYGAWITLPSEYQPVPTPKIIAGRFGMEAQKASAVHVRVFAMVQGIPMDNLEPTVDGPGRLIGVTAKSWRPDTYMPLAHVDTATAMAFLSFESRRTKLVDVYRAWRSIPLEIRPAPDIRSVAGCFELRVSAKVDDAHVARFASDHGIGAGKLVFRYGGGEGSSPSVVAAEDWRPFGVSASPGAGFSGLGVSGVAALGSAYAAPDLAYGLPGAAGSSRAVLADAAFYSVPGGGSADPGGPADYPRQGGPSSAYAADFRGDARHGRVRGASRK